LNNKYKIATIYGAAHGINDFIAGFLLSILVYQSNNLTANSIAFLVYSVIAFGGQLPAGILVDKTQNIKSFSLISLLLMIVAIALSYLSIFTAIVFSGLASAFIHVCGGAACYVSEQKNVTIAGIFHFTRCGWFNCWWHCRYHALSVISIYLFCQLHYYFF
jgi:FSR family fosmidomycin resistance protein-like MFS transporter